jgi:type VI protein secretion system component Hcp
MTQRVWTKEEIISLLKRNNEAVERGIVAIYMGQTLDEQKDSQTRYRNNVGFNKIHDKTGTYLAKYILSGRKLSGKYIDKGREIAIFYAKQLTVIANSNIK